MLNRLRLASGLVAAAGLLLAANTAQAQGPLRVGVAAGVSVPISDLGDTHETGWNATGLVNYQFPASNAGVRFEAFYNGFSGKGSVPNLRIAGGGVNLFYNLGGIGVRPYVIGGVGAYNKKLTGFDGETDIGFNAGLGAKLPLGTLNTFLEARLHSVSGDPEQWQFIPITFGIEF